MNFKKNIKEGLEWVKIAGQLRAFYDENFAKMFAVDEPIKIKNKNAFNSFVGQKTITGNLQNFLRVSEETNTPIGHVLLFGQAGYGKSLIAKTITQSLDSKLREFSGPLLTIARLKDLASKIRFGDIVFIDEIHALNRRVEEALYEIVQDFSLEGVLVPRFTMIGATTRPGGLLKPLRDRFPLQFSLQEYSNKELMKIVSNSARKNKIKMTEQAAQKMVGASRGTPRLLAQNLSVAFTMFSGLSKSVMTEEIANRIIFGALGLTLCGLNDRDIKYLKYLCGSSKACGLSTIAAALYESADDISMSIEPFLVKNGLIELTPKGRIITEAGRKKLPYQLSVLK